MNPAIAYAHLFSPVAGSEAGNYRFPGQIAFMSAEHVPLDRERLRQCGKEFAFVGIPFDEGNIGKTGSEEGPRELRLASQEYFPYWFEYQVDLFETAVDCGDVNMPKVLPNVARERIYNAVTEVLAAGMTPIICGGDRSISIPAAQALSDHIGATGKMGCLHFGAHLDLADTWAGERYVSTCALARISELPNLANVNIAHVGARNSFNPKDWIDLAAERGIRYYPMFEVFEKGVDAVAKKAIERVWAGTDGQYLSFNLNVMDASVAPGVTSAEPGGLTSREAMRIANAIGHSARPSVIDISELCPIFDVAGTTSRLAVCIVLRILAAMAHRRGELVDPSVRRTDLTDQNRHEMRSE